MAANVIKQGRYIHIRTTGFVTSTSVKVQAIEWVPSTAAGSTSIVERSTQSIIFRAKNAANIPHGTCFGKGVSVTSGLSCTVLGAGAEVILYLE